MSDQPRESVRLFVARRLREARAGKDWTQEDLAHRLGRTQTCVSLYESGRRVPRLADLFELAGALEKDVTYFLPTSAAIESVGEGER